MNVKLYKKLQSAIAFKVVNIVMIVYLIYIYIYM